MATEDNNIPNHRMCGTMEVHNRLLEQYPECRARRAEISAALETRLSEEPSFRRTCGLTTIPVVVHVVYNNDTENISDDQVTSQIEALNRDYRAKNPDIGNVPDVWKSLAQDPLIEFVLATTDPDGNPTDGITRTKTDQISFGQDDSVKSAASGGADPWPSDKYLNIWVCTLSGGLLGYAQFPGMPPATDGVVILNTAFGTTGSATAPFNMGRTTVHEVGHWLDLKHIWGDTNNCGGTDFVDDTPNAQLPNFGKPTFPHVTCSNGPDGDMFLNYMDYVDDDTMIMFTSGQISRMHATLEGSRSSIGS
jgi:pregnancy-associated plasma protein-A